MTSGESCTLASMFAACGLEYRNGDAFIEDAATSFSHDLPALMWDPHANLAFTEPGQVFPHSTTWRPTVAQAKAANPGTEHVVAFASVRDDGDQASPTVQAGTRVAAMVRPPFGPNPTSMRSILRSLHPAKYPGCTPVCARVAATVSPDRAVLLGKVPAGAAPLVLEMLAPQDLLGLMCVSKADATCLRRSDGWWKRSVLAYTWLHPKLHASALRRYHGSWHGFAVGVSRALSDVAGLLGLPQGWHRWCRVEDAPAHSGLRAVVVAESEPASKSGEQYVWVEFPRLLRALWAARLACRGDLLQLAVDCCGDAGDLKWAGMGSVVLWRGGAAELSLGGWIRGLHDAVSYDSSEGAFSMVGVQNALDAGFGVVGWVPDTESTALWGVWTGFTKDEVLAYLRHPDHAPTFSCSPYQGDMCASPTHGMTLRLFLLDRASWRNKSQRLGDLEDADELLAAVSSPALVAGSVDPPVADGAAAGGVVAWIEHAAGGKRAVAAFEEWVATVPELPPPATPMPVASTLSAFPFRFSVCHEE